MEKPNNPFSKYNYFKRILDIFFILLSAPVWAPIFIVCTIWIKLVSPGSIFFLQERIGYRQKPFLMYKFRTMHEGTCTAVHEEHVSKLIKSGEKMKKLDDSDKRVIFGGKIVRALGIDELPQFINVIRGEMSIVGPRPCTPKEFEEYPKNFKKRLNGLPGITGKWQVNGKNMTTFQRMVALDILYLRKASLSLDLFIILRTIPSIISQLKHDKQKKAAKRRFRLGTSAVASKTDFKLRTF